MKRDIYQRVLSLTHVLIPFILATLFVVYVIGANHTIENKFPAFVYSFIAALTLAALLISLLLALIKKETLSNLIEIKKINLRTIGISLVVFFAAVYFELLIVYLAAGAGLYP